MSWLDRAVGTENFPDEGWVRTPITGSSIIGIDPASGGLVFQNPGDPPHMGQVMTQGILSAAALASIRNDDDDYFLSSRRWSDLRLSMTASPINPAVFKFVTGT